MSATGCSVQGPGHRTQDTGCKILDTAGAATRGIASLQHRLWTVDFFLPAPGSYLSHQIHFPPALFEKPVGIGGSFFDGFAVDIRNYTVEIKPVRKLVAVFILAIPGIAVSYT